MSKPSEQATTFPSKAVFIITFVLLIAYLTYDFSAKEQEDFWQANYAWDSMQVKKDFGEVSVKSHSYDFIQFSQQGKKSYPKNENILQVEIKDQDYYLGYSNVVKKTKSLKFVSGFWLTDQPPKKFKRATIKVVELPIIQNGNTTVNMIVDSQLMWRQGRGTRKWMATSNSNIEFVGMQKDMYGYPFNGRKQNTVSKVLRHKDNIEPADVYIVELGTHESKNDLAETKVDFKKLITFLEKKKADAEIYVVTIPPSTKAKSEKFIKELNDGIKDLKTERVHIVDFYSILQRKGFEKYIASDGIHYNEQAYKILAKHLNLCLNEG